MRAFLLSLASTLFITGCDQPEARQDAPTPGVLPKTLVKGGRYQVRTVVDGDTVTLTTGKDVRMVGTQAPKLPLGRRGFKTWPLADAARDHLVSLIDGQAVTLYFGGLEEDRHGRWLAHLVRDDGLWLQAAMVRAGYARVYSFPDNRSALAELLAAETEARAAGRGIWAHPYYTIRSPKTLEGDIDAYLNRYEIVRGRVESTGDAGGRLFINFGGDWSTDFTAVASASTRRRFRSAPQFDERRLGGAVIEVRGWIERNQGPSVDITHPEQIVYIDE